MQLGCNGRPMHMTIPNLITVNGCIIITYNINNNFENGGQPSSWIFKILNSC